MYKIINNTTGKTTIIEGNFPVLIVEAMLNRGDKLIIISTYSNTIKIPVAIPENGLIIWDWEEYKM